MAGSALSGPIFVYGNMLNVAPSGVTPGALNPDPDAGPSGEYQGDGIVDVRFYFPKDKLTGYTGAVAGHFNVPSLCGVTTIPSALGSANIAAAQNVTSGTAMTLAGRSLGVEVNIPIRPFVGSVNGAAPVTAALALDFGFDFGTTNTTAGTANQVSVGSGLNFFVGMPIAIASAGNAAGTAPLFAVVTGVSGNTITINANAASVQTGVAIGTGDLWGPSPVGNPMPVAAMPWLAAGPGLWLDPRQALTRGVRITGVAGGSGGTFTVKGWDVYHAPMSETITVGAGAVTGWGKKAFKYIGSVTPNFSNAFNYSVGTSDVFGLNYRSPVWDQTDIFWAATFMNVVQGYTAPDDTNPATPTRGDVRGTIQVSANGGGTGIGATASNGALSGLVMTGNRFSASLFPLVNQAVATSAFNPAPLYGVTQA